MMTLFFLISGIFITSITVLMSFYFSRQPEPVMDFAFEQLNLFPLLLYMLSIFMYYLFRNTLNRLISTLLVSIAVSIQLFYSFFLLLEVFNSR